MTRSKSESDLTRLLNVDLDIYARNDLRPLVQAFGRKVIVLHVGRQARVHAAHLELARPAKTADTAIQLFCRHIGRLPKQARKLWDAASRRDFNVGVQVGSSPFCSEFPIAEATVKAVSNLGARILFSVYAEPEDEQGNS